MAIVFANRNKPDNPIVGCDRLLVTMGGYGWHGEESFVNDKANGFELERSHIRDAQMLERLCFVLVVTTLYLTAQGLDVVKAGDRPPVDVHWLRGNSFFRI